MLVVNGSDQRARTKASLKGRTYETRNSTTHTSKGNNTQQTNNKQSVDKQRTMCYYNNVKRTTHTTTREKRYRV